MKLLHTFVSSLLAHRVAAILGLILLKGIHAGLLLYLTICASPETSAGGLALHTGDTHSYIGAMENFIHTGVYYFDNGREKVYAGRVPHYSIPYYIFRTVSDQDTAQNLVVITQWIVECISLYFLGLIIFRLTRNTYAFGAMLLLAVVASNATMMSLYLAPESFSCSLLIFVLYYYLVYREEKKTKHLVALSLMLAALTTMKSYYAVFYAVIGWEIWSQGNFNIRAALRPARVLAVPILVFLSPWAIRNYGLYHTFIPLQINVYAGYDYSDAELAFRRYLRAWGGDFIFWEPGHAGCYFLPKEGIPCTFTLPDYVYTTQYGPTEVESIRQRFINFHRQYSPEADSALTHAFDRMTENYRSEKPIRFYMLSPLLLTKQFLVHSGSYYLPVHANAPCYHPAQLAVKLSESLLYWLGLIVGVPGLALISFRKKGILFGALPWILIILFPLALGFAEARYFRTVEPVLYLGAVYLLFDLGRRVSAGDNLDLR